METRREETMDSTETIMGEQVRVTRSKTGVARQATVLLGSPDRPGARAKDGPEARSMRKLKRTLVAKHLGLPVNKVRAQARYSCLRQRVDGTIERRNARGHIVGIHRPA
jgi:hypothetical protein